MMDLERFLSDLRETEAAAAADLTLVYGSCALGLERALSDVDVMFVVANQALRSTVLETAEKEVTQLHLRHGLQLDREVPFENKLVVTKHDCAKAVQLAGFPDLPITPGRAATRLAPIEKRTDFLASDHMRWRLILNVLTTPHIFVDGAARYHDALIAQADIAIARLALTLSDTQPSSVAALVRLLLRSPAAPYHDGDLYLGYRADSVLVTRHLRSRVALGLARLSA